MTLTDPRRTTNVSRGREPRRIRSSAAGGNGASRERRRVLEAQRGAIVLAESDGLDPKMRLRALAVGQGEPPGRFHYSKKLTARCYASGVSLLYSTLTADDETKVTQSIADGAMASVMCVLLRTPRKRLGVLHLDRCFWQSPFTEDDRSLDEGPQTTVTISRGFWIGKSEVSQADYMFVMGTNPTLEGDGTALYISNLLDGRDVKISRLARGIATGSVLEFANREMLADALKGRQSF